MAREIGNAAYELNLWTVILYVQLRYWLNSMELGGGGGGLGEGGLGVKMSEILVNGMQDVNETRLPQSKALIQHSLFTSIKTSKCLKQFLHHGLNTAVYSIKHVYKKHETGNPTQSLRLSEESDRIPRI